jgi:hypothetical protein
MPARGCLTSAPKRALSDSSSCPVETSPAGLHYDLARRWMPMPQWSRCLNQSLDLHISIRENNKVGKKSLPRNACMQSDYNVSDHAGRVHSSCGQIWLMWLKPCSIDWIFVLALPWVPTLMVCDNDLKYREIERMMITQKIQWFLDRFRPLRG